MGTIRAICISEKRGTVKVPIEKARFIEDFGIEGDAHAGKWHRQVSLLGFENINAFEARGAAVEDGDFGENLIIEGIDLYHIPIGTRLHAGEVILEVTQIGKECHKGCVIFQQIGDCIMPREGIFTKVIQGGTLEIGAEIYAEESVPRRRHYVK